MIQGTTGVKQTEGLKQVSHNLSDTESLNPKGFAVFEEFQSLDMECQKIITNSNHLRERTSIPPGGPRWFQDRWAATAVEDISRWLA